MEKKKMLLAVKHLVISGCGTSLYAGLYGARLMRWLGCFDTVSAIDAAEVTTDDFPQEKPGLLVLSQSGETKDTHRALELAQDNNMPVFSIINQVGSLIARTTQCGVYLYAGREHAVASTKAFTTQVTALALVASWFAQNRTDGNVNLARRQRLVTAIHRLPIFSGMTLSTRPQCKEVAQKLKNAKSMFVLGKGFAQPIAMEAALKIKEITYIHAEAFSGGALKHGPFALLEKGTPVVLIVLDDKHKQLMQIAAHEVKARGAYTIVITDKAELAEGISDETIVVPSEAGPLAALLCTIPLQLIAYELAVAKGINPDKPKNLAKAVTVD